MGLVKLRERELHVWAAITERLLLIEKAARAHIREMARGSFTTKSRGTLEELRQALARRPRP